jgi:DNA-binding transcriptional LysR family regulator
MEELDELQQKPLGLITLACTRFIATSYMPKIMQEFSTKYPAIQFDVKTSNEPIKLLDQCDLAMVSGRIPALGLIARRVGEYQRILCASKNYVAKYSMPVRLSDLQNHRCLCHSVQERSRWAFAQDDEIVIEEVKPHVATDCFLMLAEMLYAGLGIARIARPLVADRLKSGDLVELLPSYRCVYPDGGIPGMWMVFSDRRMLSRTRLFSDFLARELRKTDTAGAI